MKKKSINGVVQDNRKTFQERASCHLWWSSEEINCTDKQKSYTEFSNLGVTKTFVGKTLGGMTKVCTEAVYGEGGRKEDSI